MKPSLKKRLLRIWDTLVRFTNWCEKHGVPKMIIEAILKLFMWWIKTKIS